MRYDALIPNMRIATLAGLLSLLLGTIGLVASVLMGAASLALVLVLPVLVFEGPLPVLSFIMILVGIFLLAFSGIRPHCGKASDKKKDNWGGIVLVGPFPILFGNLKGAVPACLRVTIMIASLIMAIAILILVISMLV